MLESQLSGLGIKVGIKIQKVRARYTQGVKTTKE